MAATSFGEAIRNFFRGVVSLLTTGSWKVEQMADQARSADVLLDRVPEEVDLRAQQVLDEINEALTAFAALEMKAQRYQEQEADWRSKAESMAEQARRQPEGSPERARYEQLARAAVSERLKAQDVLTTVQREIEEARPEYEEALKAVERVGFDRETAKSQVERLRVANASAEARAKLARAHREWTREGSPGAILAEAQAKVDAAIARARAEEEVADALPPTSSDINREIALTTRKQRVDEEMARLMGGSGAGR
jgi:phage shock protein A